MHSGTGHGTEARGQLGSHLAAPLPPRQSLSPGVLAGSISLLKVQTMHSGTITRMGACEEAGSHLAALVSRK